MRSTQRRSGGWSCAPACGKGSSGGPVSLSDSEEAAATADDRWLMMMGWEFSSVQSSRPSCPTTIPPTPPRARPGRRLVLPGLVRSRPGR